MRQLIIRTSATNASFQATYQWYILKFTRISLRATFIYNLHLRFVYYQQSLQVWGRYADDTTPFVYGENLDQILDELEKHMTKISEWYLYNCLNANAKKFQFSFIRFVEKAIKIENFIIKLSYAEVLLGITTDSKLSFSEYVTYLCATVNRKLHALSRFSKP